MTDRMDHAKDVLTKALSKSGSIDPGALIGDLMSANFRDYTATVNEHVEHLERMVADRDAELGAIRTRINKLFAGDFMPSETAICQAVFYPRKALIDRCRSEANAGAS